MKVSLSAPSTRAFRSPVARSSAFLVLAAIVLLTGGASGSGPEDTAVVVRRLEGELTAAFNKYDAAALDRLWGEDLTFVFPNGALAGKAERLAGLKQIPADIPQSSNESVDVKAFCDVAVAIVVSKWPGTRDGKPFAMLFRATHVWAKRAGEWKLVSAHVSQIKE
jgi:ketosteroid isomerase-like protein